MPAEDRERYREMVERVRSTGWSLVLGGESQVALESALAQLSMPDPTAKQRLAVHEAATRLGTESHEPADLTSENYYSVRNLSAPVFDAAGHVQLTLTLVGLADSISVDDVHHYRDRLMKATQRITTSLGGRAPRVVQPRLS